MFGVASGALVVVLFVLDHIYVRSARAEGRDPAKNPLTGWIKRHPVLAWVPFVVYVLVLLEVLAASG